MLPFSVLLLSTLPLATASQLPLIPPATRWRFDVAPSPDASHNYLFDSIAGLLQQFPNTRYRNGHSIVPATIPMGTLLYHGTHVHQIPRTPEWVAVDPEHSYLFCKEEVQSEGCWHLTLATTRNLKLLYFDGTSAAKLEGGPLDTQDIIIWGNSDRRRVWNETERIQTLCEWGKSLGLDGFIRTAINHEIMLCDFKNGVDVVSFLNLSGIFLNFAGSSAKPPAEELFNVAVHSGLQSGLRHNRFPGDPRIKVDLAGLISFYDPELFPSLVDKRRGQERWIHRVGPRILASERASLLRRLEHVLSDSNVGSGIDWTALIRVVVERYADRLEVLQYMLNTTSISESRTEIKNALGDIQEYTTSILTPYLINRVQPGRNSDLDWDQPIFEQCATTHTRFAASARLTRSETLVLGAVEGVLHEICRVVVRMWAEGAMLPLDGDETPLTQVAEKWSWAINELIKWLDWNVWVKCKPACGFEETCYIPTWPYLPGLWPSASSMPISEGMPDGFLRPKPLCLRRVLPFGRIPMS